MQGFANTIAQFAERLTQLEQRGYSENFEGGRGLEGGPNPPEKFFSAEGVEIARESKIFKMDAYLSEEFKKVVKTQLDYFEQQWREEKEEGQEKFDSDETLAGTSFTPSTLSVSLGNKNFGSMADLHAWFERLEDTGKVPLALFPSWPVLFDRMWIEMVGLTRDIREIKAISDLGSKDNDVHAAQALAGCGLPKLYVRKSRTGEIFA